MLTLNRAIARTLGLVALAALGLALLLAWAASGFSALSGWLSYFAVLLFCAALLAIAWRAIAPERPPRWLLLLLLGAALLRLAVGVVWLLALPDLGYDTPVQNAGYVMEDAYNRDAAAWELAQSDNSLFDAFRGYSVTDQYGGLLFLSAVVYRYLGSPTHQPLLVLAIAAAVSATALLFAWAAARRLWGDGTAHIAAWGLALYPEALLLGSSQMREAFSIAFTVAALYGILRVRESRSRAGLALIVLPVLVAFPLSEPFALSLLGLQALVALALDEWHLVRRRRFWLPMLILTAIVLAVVLLRGDLWIVQSARWQAYVSAHASGWVARQFRRMPLWGQIPFLLAYGAVRPLLPAAIFADGLPLWRVVAVWRALGWTVVLALLLYASYLAIRHKQLLKLPGVLLVANWFVVLVASYRGGGDLWDNPRYRSAFAGVQIMLAAWAWVRSRETKDPWLRRALVGVVCLVAWFVPWYLRRYGTLEWPVVELHHVIGLGLASAALYAIWDWVGS
jgi:hypothetical protein